MVLNMDLNKVSDKMVRFGSQLTMKMVLNMDLKNDFKMDKLEKEQVMKTITKSLKKSFIHNIHVQLKNT